MNKPGIVTAIPRRRYKLGEFTVIVLGEIASNDDISYRYITAVVQGSDPEPGIYITCEQAQSPNTDYTMRIVMRDGEQVIGTSSEWGDLDAFVNEAITIVSRVLNLGDEEPYRVL